MAVELKEGKEYGDAYHVGTATTHQGYIDSIEVDKSKKCCFVYLDIYREAVSGSDRKNSTPVDRKTLVISGDDYDTYCPEDTLTYAKAYEYIHTIDDLQDWKSDES